MSDDRCYKHPFEEADSLCKNCGWGFCSECLVYAFGPKEPPLCLSCALAKSGVRSNAALPPARSKRDIRRAEKEFRRRKKAAPASTEPVIAVSTGAGIDLDIPPESSPAFDWANEDDGTPNDGNLVSF